MVARDIGPGPMILDGGGPETDLRVVCFGGVEAVPEPNRTDADPAKDGNEGVKAPNIAVPRTQPTTAEVPNPEGRNT